MARSRTTAQLRTSSARAGRKGAVARTASVDAPPKPKTIAPHWARYRLLISHPTIDPAVITRKLGLAPTFPKQAGEPRKTPTGTKLPGVWPDSRWNGELSYLDDMDVEQAISAFLAAVEPSKAFWRSLAQEDARCELIVSLYGGRYQGMTLAAASLRRLAEINIALGLEIYAVEQNS